MHITVTIPARNEASNIRRCVESVKRQEHEFDSLSIFVVDNGSTDRTVKIAQDAGAIVIERPNVSIGRVRNEARDADPSADIYAFIDADCEAPPHWLVESVVHLKDSSIGAVGGYFRVPRDSNWIQSAWALPKEERTRTVDVLATGSFIVNGSLFRQLNGFNETLIAGEDTELSRRIIESGKSLLLSKSASVTHYGYPSSLLEFLKRQIWQSSDYLKSIKHGLDMTFVATNAFLLSLMLVIIGTLYRAYFLTVSGALAIAALSLLLAAHRIRQSDCSLSPKLFAQVFTLNFLYLFGRAVGLARSYYSELICWAMHGRSSAAAGSR